MNAMSGRESKSKAHFGGPASLDPEETLRLLKAFMAITDEAGRKAVIEFAEGLAMVPPQDGKPNS
jgi:hypothetical protein